MWFTNENHIDFFITLNQRILCEKNIRLKFENIQKMSKLNKISVHIENMMNWHELKFLLFYDCSNDLSKIQIFKKSKSNRRFTKKIEKKYQQYYRNNFLFTICDIVKQFEQKHKRIIFQKNNDFNHNTKFNNNKKTNNVCEIYRKKCHVEILKHFI